MIYGIYSDIHGNLEALKAVFDSMNKYGVEAKACLGDIVGYGPFPNECCQLVAANSDISLLGNHDSVAIGRESSHSFNQYARKAIEWTTEVLTEESRDYLKSLSYIEEKDDICFVHASPKSPADWSYIIDLDQAADAFDFFKSRICVVGHTHMPVLVVLEESGGIRVLEDSSCNLMDNEKLLVNVGSVGQPRDRNNMASWCLINTQNLNVDIIRVPYAIHRTQQAMENLGLPEFLIDRLSAGR
jgi:diadenosine tetraphosphatase ApaH/serine/threonine PP2A family protein phosphatase